MLTFWCVGSGENNRDGINGDGGREEARRTGRKFMRESKGEWKQGRERKEVERVEHKKKGRQKRRREKEEERKERRKESLVFHPWSHFICDTLP